MIKEGLVKRLKDGRVRLSGEGNCLLTIYADSTDVAEPVFNHLNLKSNEWKERYWKDISLIGVLHIAPESYNISLGYSGAFSVLDQMLSNNDFCFIPGCFPNLKITQDRIRKLKKVDSNQEGSIFCNRVVSKYMGKEWVWFFSHGSSTGEETDTYYTPEKPLNSFLEEELYPYEVVLSAYLTLRTAANNRQFELIGIAGKPYTEVDSDSSLEEMTIARRGRNTPQPSDIEELIAVFDEVRLKFSLPWEQRRLELLQNDIYPQYDENLPRVDLKKIGK